MDLEVIANYDKDVIFVKTHDFSGEIPLVDFAKLTVIHLQTGQMMITLCENYFIWNRSRKNV
jgi:hypothetical protein